MNALWFCRALSAALIQQELRGPGGDLCVVDVRPMPNGLEVSAVWRKLAPGFYAAGIRIPRPWEVARLARIEAWRFGFLLRSHLRRLFPAPQDHWKRLILRISNETDVRPWFIDVRTGDEAPAETAVRSLQALGCRVDFWKEYRGDYSSRVVLW